MTTILTTYDLGEALQRVVSETGGGGDEDVAQGFKQMGPVKPREEGEAQRALEEARRKVSEAIMAVAASKQCRPSETARGVSAGGKKGAWKRRSAAYKSSKLHGSVANSWRIRVPSR